MLLEVAGGPDTFEMASASVARMVSLVSLRCILKHKFYLC